jgi:hypothetical protein
MISGLLLATAPVAAGAAAGAAAARCDRIQQRAEALAEAMRDAYGGSWRVRVDHAARMAVVLGSD